MSILFGLPMYAGFGMKPFFESCMQLQKSLILAGVKHDFIYCSDSAVHRCRNQIVREFLETDYERLFFIDSDLEFSAEDAGKIWALDADIGVGVYTLKEVGAPYAAWMNGELVNDLSQLDKPVEVDYAGTGFMMIKRKVFEALKEETPVEEFQLQDRKRNGFRYVFFDFPLEDMVKERAQEIKKEIPCSRVVRELPEDYGFCAKARKAGFKVIMDPSVRLKHYGLFGYGK